VTFYIEGIKTSLDNKIKLRFLSPNGSEIISDGINIHCTFELMLRQKIVQACEDLVKEGDTNATKLKLAMTTLLTWPASELQDTPDWENKAFRDRDGYLRMGLLTKSPLLNGIEYIFANEQNAAKFGVCCSSALQIAQYKAIKETFKFVGTDQTEYNNNLVWQKAFLPEHKGVFSTIFIRGGYYYPKLSKKVRIKQTTSMFGDWRSIKNNQDNPNPGCDNENTIQLSDLATENGMFFAHPYGKRKLIDIKSEFEKNCDAIGQTEFDSKHARRFNIMYLMKSLFNGKP
jgi:hypothetical protein